MSDSAKSKKFSSALSNNLIRSTVHIAVVAALAAGSAAVQAQEAPANTSDNQPLQEVVVTGTMIKRAEAETTEAITILKTDTLKDQGVTNVEPALNMLTSNTPAINTASAVGTSHGGGSYADAARLGLGPHPGAAGWPTAG